MLAFKLGAVILVVLLAAELQIRWLARKPELNTEPQVVLILGSGGGPNSPVVLDRAEIAKELISRYPNARLIFTGNGGLGEVKNYREALINQGFSPEKIESEDFSTDTWTNIANTKKMLKGDEVVALITSDFHQRRSLAIARAQGLNAFTYGHNRRQYKWNWLYLAKERLSNLKVSLLLISRLF